MSRATIDLPNGDFIVWGEDRAMHTWFALMYDKGQNENDAPAKVIGYHPVEAEIAREDRPDIEIGPHPVPSVTRLIELIGELWGIDMTREMK